MPVIHHVTVILRRWTITLDEIAHLAHNRCCLFQLLRLFWRPGGYLQHEQQLTEAH